MGLDLVSGEPFWITRNRALLRDYPPLDKNTTCDVVIIGGGITGALVADRLTRDGLDTLLLDKRPIGRGSTSASTALLMYSTDTGLADLGNRIGDAAAQRVYQLGAEAIATLETISEEVGGADFAHRPAFYLASSNDDVRKLRNECDAMTKAGYGVEFIERDELQDKYGIARPAAILSLGNGELDPVALTCKLISRTESRGLQVCSGTTAVSVGSRKGYVELRTQNGFTVRAHWAVFASGYETEHFLPLPNVNLKSTYVLATHPMDSFPGWHARALIWETQRPYVFLRTTTDGRAIAGGADVDVVDESARDRLAPRQFGLLQKQARELLPQMDFSPSQAWAGTFSDTDDGLPYIGPHPQMPHVFFALGYGGNGITFGAIAAGMICDTICRTATSDMHIFRLDR